MAIVVKSEKFKSGLILNIKINVFIFHNIPAFSLFLLNKKK